MKSFSYKWLITIFAILLLAIGMIWIIVRETNSPSIPSSKTTQPQETADWSTTVTTSSDTNSQTEAPDFIVLNSEGKEVRLSDYRGTPVVLNFWASWCPPCKAEMPDFETAYQTYGNEVQFLMVNLTDGSYETIETAKKHIRNNAYTFPVFYDTQSSAAIAYGISSIPVTIFITKDGYIASGTVGMLSASRLEAGIQFLLSNT